MTNLERAINHIKTRADAWAVKEVTEALQSISERLDKALSQEPCEWGRMTFDATTGISVFEFSDETIKKVKQAELEQCDDAVSREYLKKIAQSEGAYGYVSAHDIATAPSVTPMRDATPKEQKSVNDYIKSISTPTGIKFNDAISREAVCDYIADYVNDEYSTQAECEMADFMIEGIQHLPSVTVPMSVIEDIKAEIMKCRDMSKFDRVFATHIIDKYTK